MSEEKPLGELITELAAQLGRYAQQQARAGVQDILLQPLWRLGLRTALLFAAMALFVAGVVFVGLFVALGLSSVLGEAYFWGYLAAGVIPLGGAALLWLRAWRMGREERQDGRRKAGAGGDRDKRGSGPDVGGLV